MDLKKMFGAEVKRRRTQLGISQEQFAERANLHRTYISDVEAGKRNPSLASIERLAVALNAPISAVFGSAEKPAVPPRAARGFAMGAGAAGILLIQDDHKASALTVALFKKIKLANRLQVIRNGTAALDLLFCRGAHAQKRIIDQPQLVLLDLEMADDQGLEVLRRLKANDLARAIPVIALIRFRADPRRRQALRLGAADAIVKPLDFKNFSQIMSALSFGWLLLKSEIRPIL